MSEYASQFLYSEHNIVQGMKFTIYEPRPIGQSDENSTSQN